MPNNEAEERYRWIAPILKGKITIEEALKVIPFCERTVKYWLSAYREDGIDGLRDESRAPHSCPWTTPQEAKNKVLELRKDFHVGGKKIFWKMQKLGFNIKERTVNKILENAGLTRRYRTRRKPAELYQPQRFTVPGEMVEVDVKYGVKLSENS